MNWDDVSDEVIDKRISLIEAEKLESRINETTENGTIEELSDLLYEAAYTGLYVDCCFCSSWDDMGPIIQSSGIIVDGNGVAWRVKEDEDAYADFVNCPEKPLRAAAIVYLMMNGVKPEGCK